MLLCDALPAEAEWPTQYFTASTARQSHPARPSAPEAGGILAQALPDLESGQDAGSWTFQRQT